MTSYVCFPSFHVSWKDLIFCFTCFEMHCLKKVMSKLFFVWHSSFFSNWCYSLSEAYFPWLVPSLSHAFTFLTLSFLSYVSHEVTSSSCVHSHICLFHPPIYSTWKSCPFLISAFWSPAYVFRSESIAVFWETFLDPQAEKDFFFPTIIRKLFCLSIAELNIFCFVL